MDSFLTNYYGQEMGRAMRILAEDPRTVFLGQWYGRVGWTLANIPENKKIELPVIEDAQLGMCIGLALMGFVPISCYVRWPFLLLAANQLVNHLDKMEKMSGGGYKPKVIVRTAVGSTRPLSPGCQSDGDYTEAFRLMLTNVDVVELKNGRQIVPAYQAALQSDRSTILVEYGDNYEPRNHQKFGKPHTFPCGCRGILPENAGESNLFAYGTGRSFTCRVSQILMGSNKAAKRGGYAPIDSETPHHIIRQMMKRTDCELCGELLSWSALGQGKTPHLHHNHKTGEIYGFTHPVCNPRAMEQEIERLKQEVKKWETLLA